MSCIHGVFGFKSRSNLGLSESANPQILFIYISLFQSALDGNRFWNSSKTMEKQGGEVHGVHTIGGTFV